MGKKAVMGALTLYLDFINLFIMLLKTYLVKDDSLFYFLRFFQLVFLIKFLDQRIF